MSDMEEFRATLAPHGDLVTASRNMHHGLALDDRWQVTIRFEKAHNDLPSRLPMKNMQVEGMPADECCLCGQRGHVRKDYPKLKEVSSSRQKPEEDATVEPADAGDVKRSRAESEEKYVGMTPKQKENGKRAERRAAQRKRFKKNQMDIDSSNPSEDNSTDQNEGEETLGEHSG
ncbi:hypothetical protein A0J61_09879 [Choanephora cucurbitarum]|uniref:CCHC-type domain-containing protein n=1 Tax=Choanephora cucurbitarum TaxID=101091 RepID=A0A1C7N0A8_9FUNG|nr:hypothetical protein A0J61_09879 [Choanephora cucurbitarum]